MLRTLCRIGHIFFRIRHIKNGWPSAFRLPVLTNSSGRRGVFYFLPAILTECLVWTTFSSGFFSSLVCLSCRQASPLSFSPDFIAGILLLPRSLPQKFPPKQISSQGYAPVGSFLLPGMDSMLRFASYATITGPSICCFRDRVNNVACGPIFVAHRAKRTELRQKLYKPLLWSESLPVFKVKFQERCLRKSRRALSGRKSAACYNFCRSSVSWRDCATKMGPHVHCLPDHETAKSRVR